MCYLDLEPCSVWCEDERRARKPHRCSGCGRTIQPGEVYLHHFDVFEGHANTEKCCLECRNDRHEFCAEHERVCVPSSLLELVGECIGEDAEFDDDDNRLPSRWDALYDRLKARIAAAKE